MKSVNSSTLCVWFVSSFKYIGKASNSSTDIYNSVLTLRSLLYPTTVVWCCIPLPCTKRYISWSVIVRCSYSSPMYFSNSNSLCVLCNSDMLILQSSYCSVISKWCFRMMVSGYSIWLITIFDCCKISVSWFNKLSISNINCDGCMYRSNLGSTAISTLSFKVIVRK